jgi:hypothetical protein
VGTVPWLEEEEEDTNPTQFRIFKRKALCRDIVVVVVVVVIIIIIIIMMCCVDLH